ncbi:MAG: PTS lactose/cellobiose transporter subunit IIA [Brevinema sp.]
MTNEKLEEVVMGLVGFAGEGRSLSIEALRFARRGEFDQADAALKAANEALLEAHHIQTELIQGEIQGDNIHITLLMVHAQDHLMNALLAKELVEELIIDKKEMSKK